MPAVTDQPAAATAGPAICASTAGTTVAPVADQPRRAAGPTGDPCRRLRITSSTVADQQPARPPLGSAAVPFVPLPISGRPKRARVGALIAPNRSCSTACSGAASTCALIA